MPKGIYKRKEVGSKYDAGTVHDCPTGQLVVVEKLPRVEGKQPRAIIRFINTGSVVNCQLCNISTGKVKDPRTPTVYGVGYIGSTLVVPQRGHPLRNMYDLWANMLKRCYGNVEASYKDCTVDSRWHSFTNFVNTLPNIPGFQDWAAGANLHLDKDMRVPGNRVYSMDTCAFITESANLQDASNRRWAKRNDLSLTTER